MLTLWMGRATIRPDHESAGHVINHDPYHCVDEWYKRGKVRGGNAVWHARIIMFMAGAEAERMCLQSKPELIGDGDDRYQIALAAEEILHPKPADLGRHEARLRKMTRMLVRRHRALIERVANKLLANGSLSANALDKLVGRSLDDVKPNAPELLLLHSDAAAEEENPYDREELQHKGGDEAA